MLSTNFSLNIICNGILRFLWLFLASFSSYCLAACNGETHARGTVDFGEIIEVKDSDPIGTVLKEVPVNAYANVICQPLPGEGGNLGYGLIIGTRQRTSGEACASNVPGIGYQVIINPNPRSHTSIFSALANARAVCYAYSYTSQGVFGASNYLQIQPGDISVRLIKTGPVPKNSMVLDNNVFSVSAAQGDTIGLIVTTAKSVSIRTQTPSCTFSAASQIVDLGKVDSNTVNNGNAPYKLFNLPFNCEGGTNLNLVQLNVDGKGVSSDVPGLIMPDDNQTGNAKNVLIEIVDNNQQRLVFKKNFSVSIAATNGNIPFKARLHSQLGKLAGPGKVSASLTFTLTQQ